MQNKNNFEELTQDQKSIISTIKIDLKAKLASCPDFNTTFHVIRFLNARKWDIEKTKKMLEDYLIFRDENNYTNICNFSFDPYKDVIYNNYFSGQYFTDKEGRPVVIEQLGLSNPKELFKNIDDEKIKYFYIQFFQRLLHIQMPLCSKLAGRRIDRIVQIVDLKNVNVRKVFDSSFIKFLKFMAKIGQDYYPEILHVTYVINTPLLFYGIYNMLKYLVDQSTRDRVKLFSGPATKELLEIIDADKLPLGMGGTCQIDVRQCPGPWSSEIERVKANGGFLLKDRSCEFKYFYTVEEKIETNINNENMLSVIREIKMNRDEVMEVRKFVPSLRSFSNMCLKE